MKPEPSPLLGPIPAIDDLCDQIKAEVSRIDNDTSQQQAREIARSIILIATDVQRQAIELMKITEASI